MVGSTQIMASPAPGVAACIGLHVSIWPSSKFSSENIKILLAATLRVVDAFRICDVYIHFIKTKQLYHHTLRELEIVDLERGCLSQISTLQSMLIPQILFY